MPSIGGGGSGGGFHGGGFSGGGSFGGGGGYHGGGYYGGYGYRRGGIFSSIISAILSPLIFGVIGIVCLVLFFAMVGKPGSKQIDYDESAFQSYAMNRYYELYGSSEDDILFVFLASENPETDGYYQISVCGDNLRANVTNMFGNDSTVFGGAIDRMLPENYTNSMLPAVRNALETTSNSIQYLGDPSKYYYTLPTGTRNASRLVNNTSYLNINQELAEQALSEFTGETDIVMSIYIDDMDNVFKRTNFTWIFLVAGIICLGISFVLIFLAVKAVKAFKARKSGGSTGSSGSMGSGRFY